MIKDVMRRDKTNVIGSRKMLVKVKENVRNDDNSEIKTLS